MTTTHTPRPWTLRSNTIFNTTTNPALRIAEIPNLRMHGPRKETDHDEEQANAALIAAAPDLLAALENVAKIAWHSENDGSPDLPNVDRWRIVNAARAAIAAARGEA